MKMLLDFLTDYEKITLHLMYGEKDKFCINVLNADVLNSANALVALGLARKINTKTYSLTEKGRKFVDSILESEE